MGPDATLSAVLLGTEEGRWNRRGRQLQPPEEEVRWKKGTEERADLVASQKKEAATELGRMGSPVPSRSAGVEERPACPPDDGGAAQPADDALHLRVG